MTRYARALGSKGSNARVPEESTPWSAMAPVSNQLDKLKRTDTIDDELPAPATTKKLMKAAKKIVKLNESISPSKIKSEFNNQPAESVLTTAEKVPKNKTITNENAEATLPSTGNYFISKQSNGHN